MKTSKSWLFSLTLLLTMLMSSAQARIVYDFTALDQRQERVVENPDITEESLVTLNLPIEFVKQQMRQALLADGSPIKSLPRIEFDPMQNLVILEGDIEIPADILRDLQDIAGSEAVPVMHHFRAAFKLPSPRVLALTRYFQIEFVELKIGEMSYLEAMNVIGNFTANIMMNTSFMNWAMDINPEIADNEDENINLKLKRFIEKKQLRFRDRSVAFKLDLAQIAGLDAYAGIEDLRLWFVGPVVFKGTQDRVMLRVEAGLNKPDSSWFAALKERLDHDARSLEAVRAELYTKFSDLATLSTHFQELVASTRKDFRLGALEPRLESEINDIHPTLMKRAREVLSLSNPVFKADPENTHYLFVKEAYEHVVSAMTEVKRRNFITSSLQNGGVAGNGKPFLEKRISQDALNQAVRFFRDVDFEGEKLFTDIHLVIAPQVPGLVIRGRMNIDINVLMAIGLEGEDIEWPNERMRADEKTWGAGVPFEATIRLHMMDNSWLGIDLDKISLFEGSQRIWMDHSNSHGAQLANYIKMAVAQTLITTLIDQPSDEAPAVEIENAHQKVLTKIQGQSQIYATSRIGDSPEQILRSLVDVARIDIDKNPFLVAGREYVAGKTELLFKNLVKHDPESDLLMLKLDPRVVSDTIVATENNVQVWNIEAVFDKKLNNTFLDLSLGYGKRSRSYVQSLFSRAEYSDGQNFAGIDESKGRAPRDLGIEINLSSFEKLTNRILSDAATQQNKAVEEELKKDEEFESYLVRDMGLSAVRDGVLGVNITLTHVKKSKRGWYNPSRWFGETWPVDRKTLSLSAEMALSVEPVSKYKDEIKLSPNEVFLGEELLRFDLRAVKANANGDLGVLDRAVNLIGGLNFGSSTIARKLKKVILKFAAGYLNDTDPNKNGNTVLGGVHLNQFAKVLVHDEELLIQLNPHMMGVAFDVKLLQGHNYNGKALGLTVNPNTQKLSVDLQTIGNLAAVDKAELAWVMDEAMKLFAPYLNERNPTELVRKLNRLELWDRSFYATDITKMALYPRLIAMAGRYDALASIIEQDQNIVDAVLGLQSAARAGDQAKRQLTVAGVETMYLAAAGLVLHGNMQRLINKLDAMGVANQVTYIDDMRARSQHLATNYIERLMSVYQAKYQANNAKIIAKGPTDWSYATFPDAKFSQEAWARLRAWVTKFHN